MSPTFPVPFTKMSGTGNDFIIIDHRRQFLAGSDLPAFVRAVCRRKFSVGADGLILIENSDRADFSWQFFNADGSVAEMCGNGARCAARFAHEKKIAPAVMRFLTLAGEIEAHVDPGGRNSVKIRLTQPTAIALQRLINLATDKGDRELSCHFINTGVPHTVLMVDEISKAPVVKWGRLIRFHRSFQPAGTNVNFVQVLADGAIRIRTYERGVEDETMACGTGAVASAIIASLLEPGGRRVVPPVRVITAGGGELFVHFAVAGRPATAADIVVSDVFLEGPANFIYDGQLLAESLV